MDRLALGQSRDRLDIGVLGCTQNESIRFKAIGQLEAVVNNGHEATRKTAKGEPATGSPDP